MNEVKINNPSITVDKVWKWIVDYNVVNKITVEEYLKLLNKYGYKQFCKVHKGIVYNFLKSIEQGKLLEFYQDMIQAYENINEIKISPRIPLIKGEYYIIKPTPNSTRAMEYIGQKGEEYEFRMPGFGKRNIFIKNIDGKIIKKMNKSIIQEYSDKTILSTIERWKSENPKADPNISKQLIQRFDQIKSSLPQKLNIVVLSDKLKQNNNYLNIDKYSFDDMVKLIRSLPENPDKIKKDAINNFVNSKDQIPKQTAQSYVARFMNKKDTLKYAIENGLEDGSLTKEEVREYIPKRLLSQEAFLDPRNWEWHPFEQMLDALFPSQRLAGEEENNATTNADKVYDKDGIEIYKGDDVNKCISYNPKIEKTGRKKYGWCVTQVGNTNYDYYRFKEEAPTFYFIFDRSRSSEPEHSPFKDKWHAFVIQVYKDGKSYMLTDANNRDNSDYPSWEALGRALPSDLWGKIKGLQNIFKPIALSGVERGRKMAQGKNLSLDEFKELSQDDKILYVQGKSSKNELTKEILDILPQYKISYEGRSTTLANVAIDSGQKFPYSAFKNNEQLAKRYAIFRFRHTNYSKDPIPLPYVKYLDEEAKQKYLDTFDDNLNFNYIEKYFGPTAAKNYVDKQVKKLDYLPINAFKYISNPKLKQLYEIYSKLFTSWKTGSDFDASEGKLESSFDMPEQNITPVPINAKTWAGLSTSERKIIVDLAEKYNKNTKYSTLLYALPFIVKDGSNKYILLPKNNDEYVYNEWVLMDVEGNVIKNKIPGTTKIGNITLISGFPEASSDYDRIYDIKNIGIKLNEEIENTIYGTILNLVNK